MHNIYSVLIILGAVQGLSEFLPISSSGHLVLLEQVGLLKETMLAMGTGSEILTNVVLHCATLCAVIVFLRKDILRIMGGALRALCTRELSSPELKTAFFLAIATIPGGMIGFACHELIKGLFSSVVPVLLLLILNGLMLLSAKIMPRGNRKLSGIGVFRALLVGLAQAVAIVPGISRSGATIVCGMAGGMSPEESARFSFLLSIPVIAGAGLYETLQSQNGALRADIVLPLLAASLVSFFVALGSLKLLFAMVRRIRIDVFGYYTIAVGLVGLGLYYFV